MHFVNQYTIDIANVLASISRYCNILETYFPIIILSILAAAESILQYAIYWSRDIAILKWPIPLFFYVGAPVRTKPGNRGVLPRDQLVLFQKTKKFWPHDSRFALLVYMTALLRTSTAPLYGSVRAEDQKVVHSAHIFKTLTHDARSVDLSSALSPSASHAAALDYLREGQTRVSAILGKRLAFYSPNPVNLSLLSRKELIVLLDDLDISHGLSQRDLDIFLCDDLQALMRWEQEQMAATSNDSSEVVDSDEFAMNIIDALLEVVKDDLLNGTLFGADPHINDAIQSAIAAGSEEIGDVARAYMLQIVRDATKMVIS